MATARVNAIQIRRGVDKQATFWYREKNTSHQKGTSSMTSRILQEMTPDKMCQQMALPVLEEIYPRELVYQVLHDLDRWEQRERKLTHVLMVYLLIAWTLLPTMALKRVWSQLTSALRWLSHEVCSPGLPGASALSYRRRTLGVGPLRLQRPEIALVNPHAAMQDDDAVGVGMRQRVRPRVPPAVQIIECKSVDAGFAVAGGSADIAWRAGTAPHGGSRNQFTHVR